MLSVSATLVDSVITEVRDGVVSAAGFPHPVMPKMREAQRSVAVVFFRFIFS